MEENQENKVSKEEIEKLKVENQHEVKLKQLEIKNEQFKQTKKLTCCTCIIVFLWLIFVASALALNDQCCDPCCTHWFHLSDTVLVTLLGTTTLNIFGLSFVIKTQASARKKR